MFASIHTRLPWSTHLIQLPVLLVPRGLVQQIFSVLLFSIRAVLVVCGRVPWITLWTWKAYFVVGDVTAFWITDIPRPPIPHDREEPSPPFNVTLLSNLSDHPTWKTPVVDTFLGQIIALLNVLKSVAVFLLRE
ncbi:hypothetical protein BDM02DRAFT_3271518 [Thelephora ganbajun]|uniref:Uncharacterized protein n=1 Tax=Thelephora ganbajun TaxID=370292 RepID=A0ACB6Z8M5_THEGA|nr:hypothetical protein BDM02DRAFT_3271518 [Thelephora ganbajun]